MDESQKAIMPSERGQPKNSTYSMTSFTENSRKCKLICHGIKQISCCLGMGKMGKGMRGRLQRGMRKHVHYLDCADCFMGVYICQNLSN